MARTISEIKAQIAETFIAQDAIRTAYGLTDSSFDKQFSPVSLENMMFYAVASCIWILEKLFDRHRDEIDIQIESLRPHTLRWYVTKTLAYMKGRDLIMTDGVVVADHYDTSDMTDADIEKSQVVKYAVATESNTNVYIKVAGRDSNGQPTQLGDDDIDGLKAYLSQIKDAGVSIKVLNEPADNMRIELVVLYDPAILTAQYVDNDTEDSQGFRKIRLMSDGENVIETAVSEVISQLPFNGEYRNSDLMVALQAIEGVKVADIIKVEAASGGSEAYTQVVGYRRPYSGYYKLKELTVKGCAYQTTENDDI